MKIGSFMGKAFEVSDRRILTPGNLKGSTGADFVTHDTVGQKARSQYVAPQLRSYTFDIKLRSQNGISVRSELDYFREAAEAGKADWLVIGGKPLSSHPFIIESLSEEWNVVLIGGILTECMVSITVKEYL